MKRWIGVCPKVGPGHKTHFSANSKQYSLLRLGHVIFPRSLPKQEV